MTAKEIKSKIESILLETLQNCTDDEEVSDDFFINFVNNLVSICDKNIINGRYFLNMEVTACLKKITDNINAYKKTTQNISELTENELSSIGTLIKEKDSESIEKASEKLYELQNNLQSELVAAAANIKSFYDELDEIKKNSRLDNLTKTFNAKTYLSEIGYILKKGVERDLDLCMLLIEISNLKEIKSEHGDDAGDKILIYITNHLSTLVRSENKIYRYSDDTFLVILNRSYEKDLQNTQKRIADKITTQHVAYKEKPITLHISSGISTHKKGDDIDLFTQRAKADKRFIV